MATARLTSQARRAAILDAAVRLFSEKGFRGVTTRELAAAVGVSEPVLYQHFATKRELYRAIIEEKAVYEDRKIPTDFERMFENVTDDRQLLTELAHGIINWHAVDPAYTRLLMFSALERHELSQMFIERYPEAFLSELARFFERRIAEGVFREIDPSLAAHSFIGLASHYGLTKAIFQRCTPDLPQERIVDGFVDIFLEGIRKRS
jgi:AcrR family transcriptional regulator